MTLRPPDQLGVIAGEGFNNRVGGQLPAVVGERLEAEPMEATT